MNPTHSPDRTDVWLTPRPILDALGAFDLDPCAPAAQPWPTARATYTEADDGLAQPWFGRVWLNPPYSRPLLGRFMRRMAEPTRDAALMRQRLDACLSQWDHCTLDGKVDPPTNYGVAKAIGERVQHVVRVEVWREGRLDCGAIWNRP